MTTRNAFEPLVSLTGLAALAVYVVACTSFSPDDSQVLYPTYDPQAQSFGVGLYDRASAKATTLFTAQASPSDGSPGEAVLMRSQWFLDGGYILAAWTHDGDEQVLHLAVLPRGQSGTVRFIQIESLPEAGSQLARPLAVAESSLYLQGESNTLVRVDLRSGHVEPRSVPSKVIPYAIPLPDRIVPFAWQGAGETNVVLGIIEVPLQGGELRRLTLVPRMRGGELERVLYFQPSVSHDGKTLAVASTYVAAGDAQVASEDCALFLVDLADPQRKVTRVPVPRPPEELR